MKLPRATAVRRARSLTVAAVLLGGLVVPASSTYAGAETLGYAGPVIDVTTSGEPIDVLGLLEAAEAADVAAGRAVTDKGTRLAKISTATGYGVPKAARRAYERAAKRIERTRPGCDLPWGLLAGIGRVESDHGRYGGSELGVDGVSRPLIIGIALDGVGPVAAIPDTDNGRLDGDKVWDRAVGPMQFIPSTWANAAADGDNDGVEDPNDLHDAALAAAGYLCPASGPIGDEAGMRQALFSYNHSDYYVDLVYAFALGYHTGVFDIPAPPAPPVDVVEVVEGVEDEDAPGGKKRDGRTGDGPEPAAPPAPAEPTPSEEPTSSSPSPTKPPKPPKNTQPSSPAPDPVKPPKSPGPSPSPSPSPTPTPTPEPEVLDLAASSGSWSACGPRWCLGTLTLDLGSSPQSGAAADFDGDGAVETNKAEFDGLVGAAVSIQVERGTGVVYTINGLGFRNADGSFAS